MNIKPKVTAATASLLQLALLSSISSVDFHPVNGDSTGIPNKMRKSLMDNCMDYKDISTWLDLQDAAANRLQEHYAHLKEALAYLTGTKPSTNCCPYDKDLIKSVMDNIKIIGQLHGTIESKTLSPSGDMRIDLNKIIPRIKKLVTKGFESCCSKMEESVKELKKDLDKEFLNVKKKFKSKLNDEFSKDREELQEKHQRLWDKIKDSKESLDKLQNQTMRSGYQTSCCAELNTKTEALEKQIEDVGTETNDKTNQFEAQLKDIENMVIVLKNRTKDAKNILETQGQKVEKELESCEKEFEKLSTSLNTNHNCCESCLDKLLKRLKDLEERVTLVINNISNNDSKNGNSCLENDNRLDKIKDLTEKLQTLKPGDNSVKQIIFALVNENLRNRNKELEQEAQHLQQAANESHICCEHIGKLNTLAAHLQNKIKEMQIIFPDLLKQNKLEFEILKNRFKKTLTELDNTKHNDNEELDKLKNLQAMLQKVKSELKVQEGEVNKLLNQKNNVNLIGDFEKMAKEFKQFWLELDGRLSHLEGEHNASDPRDRLMEQHKDLSQSLDKVKLSFEDLQQHEKQYNVELEKLKQLENQETICLNACKVVPKMDDLIGKVKHIVQVLQDKKKSGVETTTKVVLKKLKPTKNVMG